MPPLSGNPDDPREFIPTHPKEMPKEKTRGKLVFDRTPGQPPLEGFIKSDEGIAFVKNPEGSYQG